MSSNTLKRHKLLSGKHHRRRADGSLETVRAGEGVVLSERERQQNQDRIVRDRKVFLPPRKRFGEG